MQGYEIVDVFKNLTEKTCKLNMSYADTLVVIRWHPSPSTFYK